MPTINELRRQQEELEAQIAAAEAAEAEGPIEIIQVTVGRVPGVTQDIELNGDRSLTTALSAAGIKVSADGRESVRVNGSVVTDMNVDLMNGDNVRVLGEVRGNDTK